MLMTSLGMFLLLVGITYAFFNYTRTGSANNFSVGRIYFNSENEETITLSNLFPIDPSDANEMNDPTKVGTYSIDIVGDTDYVDGLEYLVSITDSNISNLPISIDVNVSNGLGTSNDNYFTARESKDTTIYKKLVGDTIVGDGMLLVGYIKPNTTSGEIEGVDGTITITAYLDKNKILIADTYDGTESDNMGTTNQEAEGKTVISAAEWNTLSANGLSFKVRVEANEGIWVHESLEMIMKRNAVMDNIQSTFVSASTGIDFGAVSSDTNGKGVYTRAGTENGTNPIVYYRGAVEDNNVAFNNLCWKAVRTTDTGGVKLIYNGETNDVYEDRPLTRSQYIIPTGATNDLTFNSTDNSWEVIKTDNNAKEISFTVPAGDNYKLVQIASNEASSYGGSWTFYKNGRSLYSYGTSSSQPMNATYTYGTLTENDVIKWSFSGTASEENPTIIKLQMVQPGDLVSQNGCDQTSRPTCMGISGTYNFRFNESHYSPSYVGYMYGDVYSYNSSEGLIYTKFGRSFTWDGTNYKLSDTIVTGPDATHHYSCNSYDEEATCKYINYAFYESTGTVYYIMLSGGEDIEEAINKMKANKTDSIAKTLIDTWYASNLNNITNKLEDTIWCNDRSMGDGNNNGWIANGGDLSTFLYYGAYQRSNYASNTSTVKNEPSLACVTKNDAFTVSNGKGNQKLTYPVALLTEDEMVLAGGLAGAASTFYLYNKSNYWSMTPSLFKATGYASEFYLNNKGHVDYYGIVNDYYGLRPAISIKPGQMIKTGTGTANDPYVIE